MPETGFDKTDNLLGDTNPKTVDALDDAFDEMDNIEETAAKVLYGLQNMDRTDSPQSFSVPMTQSVKEMSSDFLTYTNFVTGKEDEVSISIIFIGCRSRRFYLLVDLSLLE